VEKPLNLPTTVCTHGPSDGRLSKLKVTLYPQVIVVVVVVVTVVVVVGVVVVVVVVVLN